MRTIEVFDWTYSDLEKRAISLDTSIAEIVNDLLFEVKENGRKEE